MAHTLLVEKCCNAAAQSVGKILSTMGGHKSSNVVPFRLVEDNISDQTVRALEELLDDARKKKIKGIAFMVVYRHGEYICNTAGWCRHYPAPTRGYVMSLVDKLGHLAGSR